MLRRSDSLYRVWNQRTDSNHRYVTDRRVRDQMVAARGYVAEGYGPHAVTMCVTPLTFRFSS